MQKPIKNTCLSTEMPSTVKSAHRSISILILHFELSTNYSNPLKSIYLLPLTSSRSLLYFFKSKISNIYICLAGTNFIIPSTLPSSSTHLSSPLITTYQPHLI